MKLGAGLLFVLLLLAACADPTIHPVGAAHYEPLPPGSVVRVFLAESDVHQPFAVVAVIRTTRKDKSQTPELDDVIPEIQEKARTVGADGVIIDATDPVRSHILTMGITVSARAIRLEPAAAGIE